MTIGDRSPIHFEMRCHSGSNVDLCVRERRFVLHQDREDIAAGRICNAIRVRIYVTLSGVRVTVPG
jgi:hypothetical protein